MIHLDRNWNGGIQFFISFFGWQICYLELVSKYWITFCLAIKENWEGDRWIRSTNVLMISLMGWNETQTKFSIKIGKRYLIDKLFTY